MALSLRNLLKKLGSGIDAITKPQPKPIQIDFSRYTSPRVQAAQRDSDKLYQDALRARRAAKPTNVIRNAPATLPRLNFADRQKNPVKRFVYSIPQEFLNAPRDVAAGSLGLGANIADIAYGKKPTNVLGNVGNIGRGFVNVYGGGRAANLASQAGSASLRNLVLRGARQGAGIGALSGGFYGLADSQGKTSDRLKQAGINTAIGGVVGAGLGAASPVLGRAYRNWRKQGSPVGMSVKNVGDNSLYSQARKYKSAEEFVAAYKGSGTQYGDYNPSLRLGGTPGSKRITELGIDPNKEITIYRGIDDTTGKLPRKIQDGDFVTTDFDSARAYAGSEKDVVSMKVKAKDLFAEDADEFLSEPFYKGSEYVYSAKETNTADLTKSQLTDIWKKATGKTGPSIQAEAAARQGRISTQSAVGATTKGAPTQQTPALQTQAGSRPTASQPGSSLPTGVSQQSSAVNKIIEALKKAKPIRGSQEALYSKERAARAGRVAAIGERVPGEKGYFQQLSQLKGRLPKKDFEGVRGALQQSDVDELFNVVEGGNMPPFEKITAKGGLAKILTGEVPTKGEISLLEEVFPSEFIKEILSKRTLTAKLFEGAADALSIPRTLMSSVDLSAPLRQGVFLAGKPKQWLPAFRNMFKYFTSEKAYQASLQQIRSRPTYEAMRRNNLAIMEGGQVMTGREERFLSKFAEKIPLVRASNRAYTGFLNQLRADVFDDILRKAKDVGASSPQLEESLASFVNAATGRGNLGVFNRASGLLSTALFSPRLLASRLNLLNPAFYYKLEPMVRKEALKSLFTFAGMGATVLGIAKLGGAEVSTDPRSSDFGKMKFGNTRYDIWGGFQQPIRAAAQMITGQSVSSTTNLPYNLGEGYKPTTRLDIALRFFESKESPVFSFLRGLIKGQNFMGDEFNVPEEVINRFIPMVVQDLYELSQEPGQNIFMGIPAPFGVGVQTYGRKEPKLSITPSGEAKVKGESPSGLAETLANKIFPKKPKFEKEKEQVIKDLKSGVISKETAKARLKQTLLEDMANKVNSSPENRQKLAPVYVNELKKSLKSDIKSVAKDYTLTEEEKKSRIKQLVDNFVKSVKEQGIDLKDVQASQKQSAAPTGNKNILSSLGPITAFGSPLWKPGLDIDLKIGDPVPSPVSGTVVASGPRGGFGNQVAVQGDDGRIWLFSHLARGIAPGQRVAAGQVIGLGGNTGNTIPGRGSDGSHLDVTVVENGRLATAQRVAQLLQSFA